MSILAAAKKAGYNNTIPLEGLPFKVVKDKELKVTSPEQVALDKLDKVLKVLEEVFLITETPIKFIVPNKLASSFIQHRGDTFFVRATEEKGVSLFKWTATFMPQARVAFSPKLIVSGRATTIFEDGELLR